VPVNEGCGSETVGERLRRLRTAQGLSQGDLAEPGISSGYVSRIERGGRRPSLSVLRKLARKLEVSADYLETGRVLSSVEERELRLADAEIALRLDEHLEQVEAQLAQLLTEAQQEGERAVMARSRIGLGLAAIRRGAYEQAIDLLEAAIQGGTVSPRSHPEPYAALAQTYAATGNTERAIALLEQCLDDVAAGAVEAATYVRFALFLSYALTDGGELERARAILDAALQRVPDEADPYTRVRIFWSQARLAAAAGEPERALATLRRAIVLLEETEDRRQLGRAHLLYGEIATLQGTASDAIAHLEQAATLLGGQPDAEDLRWLVTEQARAAAQLGQTDEAIQLAQEALSLIGNSDPAEQGAALWALAEAQAQRGDVRAADTSYTQAVELLRSQRRWYEATAAAHEWATMLRQAGRNPAEAERHAARPDTPPRVEAPRSGDHET
jgi:transcriptional regulator with XRE-family HTH domain